MQSNHSSNPATQKSQPLSSSYANIDVAYIGSELIEEIAIPLYRDFQFKVDTFNSTDEFEIFLKKSSITDIPGVILLEFSSLDFIKSFINKVRNNPLTSGIILILLSRENNEDLKKEVINLRANDIYFYPFNLSLLVERVNFLVKFKVIKAGHQDVVIPPDYKIPIGKRLFDIMVSFIALLFLSPLFLIIAIIVRLESKGPIIYKSKRAGTGYKIFDFYKFRSMVPDADKKLKQLSETNNQYNVANETAADQPKAFVKILNDPRITKVGNFLRKTSIDELPQLFNVLKGDMSIVGNRPLPLYEAEQLTSDQFAMRFLGPAGITGLWQISKRGKAEMSDTERKELDNHYARYSSFLMDIKIILKTIPAMLQKEKV